MRHNARLQHLAQANQCLLHSLHYHTMTSSCMQGLPFHTPVYNASICVQCDEIVESGAAGGKQSEPPPACKIILLPSFM